jgi:WD40 repeat protein
MSPATSSLGLHATKLGRCGLKVATGSFDDHAVKLWDVKSKTLVSELKGHSDYIVSASFSQDGKRLASGSYDGTIRIWDAKSEVRSLNPHAGKVHSVAFSPDGKLIASGHNDGDIKLWDAVTGRQLRSMKEDAYSIYSLAFSPDGEALAAHSVFDIFTWEVATGRMLRDLEGGASPISFSSMAISPDGTKTATGDGDGSIRLWDMAEGNS